MSFLFELNPNFAAFMTTNHLRYFLFSLIILGTSTVSAQRGWEAGGSLGLSYYFGDLNTGYQLNKPGPAASINGRFNFNKRTSVVFSGSYAYIYADDANSKNDFEIARNLSFSSHIIDLATTFEFNFLPYTHGSYNESFTPYVLTGFSVFRYNPRAKLGDTWYSLRDMGTEGQQVGNEYYLISGSWVYGFGVKMDLTRVWSLNIELNGRRVFTDYLDDVSTTYTDKNTLQSRRGQTAVLLSDRSMEDPRFPEIGEAGRQRGDSKDNDSFNMVKVSLMYYFGRVRCPAISEP